MGQRSRNIMERGGQEKAKDHEIESVGDGVGRTLRIVLRDEHDEEKKYIGGFLEGCTAHQGRNR